jgi:hypothetical protein
MSKVAPKIQAVRFEHPVCLSKGCEMHQHIHTSIFVGGGPLKEIAFDGDPRFLRVVCADGESHLLPLSNATTITLARVPAAS